MDRVLLAGLVFVVSCVLHACNPVSHQTTANIPVAKITAEVLDFCELTLEQLSKLPVVL